MRADLANVERRFSELLMPRGRDDERSASADDPPNTMATDRLRLTNEALLQLLRLRSPH